METKNNYQPWSEQAEQSVVGGIILNDSSLPDVMDIITVDDFHAENHALIFTAMVAASESGKPAGDITVLMETLNGSGSLSAIGGFEYLVELAENTPSAANVKYYANIVKDKSKERQVIIAARKMINTITTGEGTSEELINDAMACINGVDLDNEDESEVAYKDQLKAFLADLQAKDEAGTSITGLPTGFEDLDKALYGLHKQNLIIIAGTPGCGKSTFSMNIATNISQQLLLKGDPGHVLVFNMEMSAQEVIGRQVAYLGDVRMDGIKSPVNIGEGNCSGWKGLQNAVVRLKDAPMTIDDRPALKPEQLRAKALRTQRKHGKLSLIVVDYLQLMEVNKSQGTTADTTKISKSLKRLAKEFDCPVIALSQLSRKVMDRTSQRPIMSDLRDSGSIEQDADIVAFVHRERVDPGEHNPMENYAEIIIAKNRSGETTSVPMKCDLSKNRFHSMNGEKMPYIEPKNERKRGGFNG